MFLLCNICVLVLFLLVLCGFCCGKFDVVGLWVCFFYFLVWVLNGVGFVWFEVELGGYKEGKLGYLFFCFEFCCVRG